MRKPLLIKITVFAYVIISAASIFLLPGKYMVPFLIIFSSLSLCCFLMVIAKHLSEKIEVKTGILFRESKAEYSQIESLFAIYKLLKTDNILPPFRGWAISPDFGAIILKNIKNNKIENILECGSGVSTLIICYLMKQLGRGHLFTLEHDSKYAAQTRKQLQDNNLTNYATIIETKLIPYTINDKEWQWYDIGSIKDDQKFDLLIVDGPPFQLQQQSRYPALPIIDEYLTDGAVVLIDDCKREQDKQVVKLWLKKYNYYSDEWIETEKGAYLLTKHSQ